MDVDFSIEGALIVDDVLYVGDVETTGGYVCANENGALGVVVNHTHTLGGC